MTESELKYIDSLSRQDLVNILMQAVRQYEAAPSETHFLILAQRCTMVCTKPMVERDSIKSITDQVKLARQGKDLLSRTSKN
jgi:hypothetical protein